MILTKTEFREMHMQELWVWLVPTDEHCMSIDGMHEQYMVFE